MLRSQGSLNAYTSVASEKLNQEVSPFNRSILPRVKQISIISNAQILVICAVFFVVEFFMQLDFLGEVTPVGLGTLILLIICSIIVVGVVIERMLFLKRNVVAADWMHAYVAKKLKDSGVDEAYAFVSELGGLLPRVYEAGLARYQLPQDQSEIAMSTVISDERLELEKNLPIISTIAVVAPFIGLFGTVVGIMSTFSAVAEKGQAGVAVVSAGVAEALVATAAGLFVAITSVVFFNYFKARIGRIIAEMTGAASRLSEMMELLRNDKDFPEDLITFVE